jgi:small nuclear ribonucleoprotein (snRNP)-like protein
MNHENIVSIQQMKDALHGEIGGKSALKITLKNSENMTGYIRGFADQQTNIVLISDTYESVGMKILEVRDIRMVEYVKGQSESSKVLRAKWFSKIARF